MLAAQVVGSFIGLLWAWLTLIDRDWAKATQGDDPDHYVPLQWVNWMAPVTPTGVDLGKGKYGFTRDWATFFATLLFSTFFFFMFHLMKKEETSTTKETILKIFIVVQAFTGTTLGLTKFGWLGFNPATAVMMAIFVASQVEGAASPYTHYLWVYIIAPIIAAFLAGVLHLIHVKATTKGGDGASYD